MISQSSPHKNIQIISEPTKQPTSFYHGFTIGGETGFKLKSLGITLCVWPSTQHQSPTFYNLSFQNMLHKIISYWYLSDGPYIAGKLNGINVQILVIDWRRDTVEGSDKVTGLEIISHRYFKYRWKISYEAVIWRLLPAQQFNPRIANEATKLSEIIMMTSSQHFYY